MDTAAEFMAALINAFEANKGLGDRAVESARRHRALDANTNSIADVMKHVAGTLTPRWTHLLTTDGEKQAEREGRQLNFLSLASEAGKQIYGGKWRGD